MRHDTSCCNDAHLQVDELAKSSGSGHKAVFSEAIQAEVEASELCHAPTQSL